MTVRVLKSPRAEFRELAELAGQGDENARARLLADYRPRKVSASDELRAGVLERARIAAAESAYPDLHLRAGPATFVHADGTPKAVDRRGDPLCPQGHQKDYMDPEGLLHCRTCMRAADARYRAKVAKPPRLPRTHCAKGHELEGNRTPEGKCRTCERERRATPAYRQWNREYQREYQRARRKRLQLVE